AGNRTFDVFGGLFNMSWEVDLWGRIRRASEASQADLLASNDVRRGVVLSLVSEVATSYLTLLELDLELEIARQATKTFQDTLDLFVRQFEGGIGTMLAVARGEAAPPHAAAGMPQPAAGTPHAAPRPVAPENATSLPPGGPRGPFPPPPTLPPRVPPPQPPAGVPADILARRPDIMQAEENLRSANALVGVAVADFF